MATTATVVVVVVIIIVIVIINNAKRQGRCCRYAAEVCEDGGSAFRCPRRVQSKVGKHGHEEEEEKNRKKRWGKRRMGGEGEE